MVNERRSVKTPELPIFRPSDALSGAKFGACKETGTGRIDSCRRKKLIKHKCKHQEELHLAGWDADDDDDDDDDELDDDRTLDCDGFDMELRLWD